MSNFDGIVKEFPDIRIDYFRAGNERPPIANFLSHVHSDHLAGLESCKSVFIYCSPATREVLLRLEKYPHRMNFAKKVLETRKQTYSHLRKLLKPIPLDTPTTIELSPGNSIRVTLFDANHCIGAVCFLIEGNGKTILYTGDVRSESWWVNWLCRHPLLIPYVPSTGSAQIPVKCLDCVYLDTTFAVNDDMYKYFPPKAEGLSELLRAVSRYPKGTLFYFDSWTFGYEDVWQALSAYLDTQIHVDEYRYKLYLALANAAEPKAVEAARLIGYHCGNHFVQGSLTAHQSQIHSCEQGTGCDIWQQGKGPEGLSDFVRITPIISRHNGLDIAELGAGGGHGDLDARHELELGDPGLIGSLITLCATQLQDQPELQAKVMSLLTGFITSQTSAVSLEGCGLAEDLAGLGVDEDVSGVDEIPLDRIVPALARLIENKKAEQGAVHTFLIAAGKRADGLPRQITFPYSRHSSYAELCTLIEALKPADIHPCTVDDKNWTAVASMDHLFGHLYRTPVSFSHDQMMLRKIGLTGQALFVASRRASSTSEVDPELVQQQISRQQEDARRIAKRSHAASEDVDPLNRKRVAGQCTGSATTSRQRSPGRLTPPQHRAARAPKPRSAKAALRSAAEGRGVHLSRLAVRTTENDLRAFFKDYEVSDVFIPLHGTTTHHSTFGFVDFQNASEARRAVQESDRRKLNGELVRIVLAHGIDPPAGRSDFSRSPTCNGSKGRLSAGRVRLASREDAYNAARNENSRDWSQIGLLSTRDGHQVMEEEL
ncbi:hypothetical protein LTR62_003084 [Meristemomyces frigidus]|uniref:RRM domain-containing protein n=1 Tax=Meristemomyces frigidus TaxID=1508187 RepID=A0AAN7TSE0_9PEZI|nr:hypothetical protein LTR62_003084 [Meristemomyces frigidus]